MDGWNTSFLLGWPIFRCYVSFRECNYLDFDHSTVSSYEHMEYHDQMALDRSKMRKSVKLQWSSGGFFSVVFSYESAFSEKKKQPTNSLQITHNRTRIQNKNKKMMILWLYIICLFCSASQGCFQRIYFHRVFKSGSASPWHHADGKRPGPK